MDKIEKLIDEQYKKLKILENLKNIVNILT